MRSRKEAFAVFRETICGTFMPWTPKLIVDDFEGRVESISLEQGTVGRVRMTPIITRKTRADICNSAEECIHGNFILSGELKVEQGGRTNFAKPGDLVLYQSFTPVTLTVNPKGLLDNLAFIIPKSKLRNVASIEHCFRNTIISKVSMMSILRDCLNLIAKNFHAYSANEIAALLDASVALLPLSMGPPTAALKPPQFANVMLTEIVNFIDENLSDPNLSASTRGETIWSLEALHSQTLRRMRGDVWLLRHGATT